MLYVWARWSLCKSMSSERQRKNAGSKHGDNRMQQVTTRSKAKQSEWDLQEEVRKATKEWVNEANNINVA